MPKKREVTPLKPFPILHIYCEGEKTEPVYINGYIASKFPGDRRRNVIKVEPTRKNTPVQLVDVAVKHQRSWDCPSHDIFWVVYDRESAAKYSDELHLQAYQKAKANGINIALSNVCFELWLYLNFQQNTAPFSSYDDLMTHSRFKSHLARRGINSYNKGDKSFINAITIYDVNLACSKATNMNNQTLSSASAGKTLPHQLNPYTDMHLLLRAIDSF